MMNKVFITGVAGFIGSNLAAMLLRAGYRVSGLDNLSTGTEANVPEGVTFHRADIGDPAIYPLLQGQDAVFHLAAKTNLPDCMKDPVAASHVNTTGTANVLEAARRAKVKKVIYADTSAEYEGISEFPSPVDRVAPLSPYAVSKHGGALWCDAYRRHFDLPVAMVRYFNVYGPAQDWRRVFPPLVCSFACQLMKGQAPTIYGTGDKRRDFIYVDDVNALHLILLESEKAVGRVFNVGTGTNYSVREMFALIEAQIRSGLKPRSAPELPGEAEITLADISDGKELGWEPKIGIEEGLKRSIDYYRERVRESSEGVGR